MPLLAALFSVALACDGPCVRFLSSDFDLRLAFPSHIISPDVYNGADNPGQLRVDGTGRLDSQNRLFCNATGYRTHEFMENKCLAQRVLLLGHVARGEHVLRLGGARSRLVGFRPRELVKALATVQSALRGRLAISILAKLWRCEGPPTHRSHPPAEAERQPDDGEQGKVSDMNEKCGRAAAATMAVFARRDADHDRHPTS